MLSLLLKSKTVPPLFPSESFYKVLNVKPLQFENPDRILQKLKPYKDF